MKLDLSGLKSIVMEGPTPVFATVSGAHLYGFESPDSDVDLRGAFCMPLKDRLGLRSAEETYEVSDIREGLELDWVAHDIRKFATLMTRRNGYVLEQLFSPLVVYPGPYLEELRSVGRGCYVKHLFHHYRGFANTKRRDLEKQPSVKGLLYAYRVYFTGIHMLEDGELEANLEYLLDRVDFPEIGGVKELIERKRVGKEKAGLDEAELAPHWKQLDLLEARMESAFEKSTLPESPTTYDALDALVGRICMELG